MTGLKTGIDTASSIANIVSEFKKKTGIDTASSIANIVSEFKKEDE